MEISVRAASGGSDDLVLATSQILGEVARASAGQPSFTVCSVPSLLLAPHSWPVAGLPG